MTFHWEEGSSFIDKAWSTYKIYIPRIYVLILLLICGLSKLVKEIVPLGCYFCSLPQLKIICIVEWIGDNEVLFDFHREHRKFIYYLFEIFFPWALHVEISLSLQMTSCLQCHAY